MSQLLVVDVGTSSVRASIVRDDGSLGEVARREVLPTSPAPGFVEFDPGGLAAAVLEVSSEVLSVAGGVAAVGIANQRASTVLFDRRTSEAVAPGIGWQDLRTAGFCLMLKEEGIRLGPNQSATKLMVLLDLADPDRSRDLCFGTVDTWVASVLSGGSLHVTDHTNAGVTGLVTPDGLRFDEELCERLRVPLGVLPSIVDSSGVAGEASLLRGAPPLAALIGDQQASLVGQGRIRPGEAKATFGTGGMLDCCTGAHRPISGVRGAEGCFPIVAWSAGGRLTLGVEAIMLSAGTCVEWLRDDLQILERAEDSDALAASVPDTGGVYFVPALLGLGTPLWDFGARGTFVGITRGTGRAELARAVLEGVAHAGADLLEAAEADAGVVVETLHVDGGMSGNETFVSALAEATGRPIAVSPVTEATTLGAAFLAGTATGVWSSLEEAAGTVRPARLVAPTRRLDRGRWRQARERSLATVPELSALEF